MKSKLFAAAVVVTLLLLCLCGGGYAEAATQTLLINGRMSWNDVAGQVNAGTSLVELNGAGNDAEIVFDGGDEVELDFGVVFNNVKLINQGGNGKRVTVFANGRPLETTDTVTTEGNFWLYGGGNGKDAGNTSLTINGGRYGMICGGSYAADSAASTVYVGEAVEVGCVLGGAHGGTSTGNISVTYAAKHKADFVIGGAGEIYGSAAQSASVNNLNGYIKVVVCDGALVDEVDGACNAMISCKDIDVIVEKGARVLSNVEGGSSTSNNSTLRFTYGIGPANGYGPSQMHYKTYADIHVRMDGEGRSSDEMAYRASVTGGAIYADIYGNIDVTLNGAVEYVYGGCHSGNVKGNIQVTINGKVLAGGHNADVEIGDVYDFYGGTVTSGCIDGNVDGTITTTVNKDGVVHAVIGGCDNGGVTGTTNVHIYGTLLKEKYQSANRYLRYAGCVFGGGYVDAYEWIDASNVQGGANVYIHDGADVQGDVYGGASYARCSGGSKVYVSGNVRGDVYGGGWVADGDNRSGDIVLGYTNGAYVELNGNAKANNVYGGGRIGDIRGDSVIVLKDNAAVVNVYGTGNAYSTYYTGGNLRNIGPVLTETTGNVTIQIQDHATVADTIYGYEFVDISGAASKNLTGTATVLFEHSKGTFKRVVNADLVSVTDQSQVTIDNAYQDNAQLVNVYDLTIDDGAALEIRADAHILKNYRGDARQSGMLKIPAGKCLTADGTVTDLTKISILDNVRDNIVPEEAQVYVISGAGSTTESGDFTWVDTRNGVYMDWRANEDHTSQWWLVRLRTGNLVVSKTVSGENADKSKAFSFTITVSDQTINGAYEDVTFVNGVASFSLKHGEKKTAAGLPAGITYQVAEGDSSGYIVTVNGTDKETASGTIPLEQTVEVNFDNYQVNSPVIPQTGDNSHLILWTSLLLIASVALIGMAIYDRKKRLG